MMQIIVESWLTINAPPYRASDMSTITALTNTRTYIGNKMSRNRALTCG